MKYQTLFYGESKKNIIGLSSAEFTRSMLKVDDIFWMRDSDRTVHQQVSQVFRDPF